MKLKFTAEDFRRKELEKENERHVEQVRRLEEALRTVVRYNDGEGEYNYSSLSEYDRGNQAFDDWAVIRGKIDAVLGAVSEANERGVPAARAALEGK